MQRISVFHSCAMSDVRRPFIVGNTGREDHLDPHSLLEVRDLSVSYLSSSATIRAVRNISFQIHKSETLALAGETGSGKSTLGLAVLGLLDPQARVESGDIFFEGCNLQSLREQDWSKIRGCKIGIIFQDARSALNPVLTIRAHLIETLRAHQQLSKREAHARALALLQEVGIPEGHEKLYPFQLSGGLCQRVGIALSICNNPRLLIADEPTSSLDTTMQAQILDLLLRMKQRYELTLLLISHDLALISHVADRISIMYHGRIVESGLKEEVLASPAHPYTQSLIQCVAGLQHHFETYPLASIPGAIPIPGQSFPGCAFAARCCSSEPACRETVPDERAITNTHWVACMREPHNRDQSAKK